MATLAIQRGAPATRHDSSPEYCGGLLWEMMGDKAKKVLLRAYQACPHWSRTVAPGPKMIRIQPEMFCSGGTITVHTPCKSCSCLATVNCYRLSTSSKRQTNDGSSSYQVAMRSESYTLIWRKIVPYLSIEVSS